jgi:outer membrane protein
MLLRQILTAAGVLSLGLGIIGCDLTNPNPFDPRLLQSNERQSATQPYYGRLNPLPTTRQDAFYSIGANGQRVRPTTGPDLDESPIVRMSLQEVIHRAVLNNHDIKVAGYQPAISGTRVNEVAANFDPAYFLNAQYQQKDDLTGGQIFNSFTGTGLIETNVTSTDQGQVQTGIQQNLPAGGQVQLQYQAQYNWLSPQQTAENPFYESDLTLSLTQPLLKNFGYDVNHAQIVIDRLNQKVDLLEFRKTLETTAFDIERDYWQLLQAIRDIEIEKELVLQTEETYRVLYNRYKQNLDVSPLQVAQAQAQLEERRTLLIQYKSQARDLSDQIKGLMSDPEYPVSSDVVILPADSPVEEPLKFQVEDEINTAMENRLELGEQQLKIDSATVTVGVARNNLLPEFDFVGSVGPQGVAGNLGEAITSNAQFNHYDFTVGFKLNVPLGNRAARAIWVRTLLQRLQAIEQYRSFIESISVEVTTAARAVVTNWQVMDSSRRSRFAAQDALRDINARVRANEPLTPEFVQLKLQEQDLYSSAMHTESQAVANYNIAIAQLEQAKGTLLRYNNVLMVEGEPRPEENGVPHF